MSQRRPLHVCGVRVSRYGRGCVRIRIYRFHRFGKHFLFLADEINSTNGN